MSQKLTIKAGKGVAPYDMVFDDEGNRDDPCPVFCVHGLIHTRHSFDRLTEALVKEGRRVVKPDLVGHGASDWSSDPLRYHIPFYAQDCAQLIAHLGLKAVDWIGISLGGLVGLRAIADEKVPVHHFVMVDVGPEVPLAFGHDLANWLDRINIFQDRESFLDWRVTVLQPGGPMSDEERRYRGAFDGRPLPDGTWTDVYDKKIALRHRQAANAGEAWDDWKSYDQITCPTLVFHGLNSPVLTPQLAQKMRERGPHPKIIDIPDVGHYPALVDARQIDLLSRFLKEA